MNETVMNKVCIRGLYKIFGPSSTEMVAHVEQGTSKAELLDQYGHVLGLQNINIDMKAGQITVIMGLSGSGKSTLIRHLNRLIEPTQGEILVDGQDVMKMDKAALQETRQKKMSMVFQKFALLPHKSVIDNAAMPLSVQGIAAQDANKKRKNGLNVWGLMGLKIGFPLNFQGVCNNAWGLRAL